MKETFFSDIVVPIEESNDGRETLQNVPENDSNDYRIIKIEDVQKDSKIIEDYYSAMTKKTTHQTQPDVDDIVRVPNNNNLPHPSHYIKLDNNNNNNDGGVGGSSSGSGDYNNYYYYYDYKEGKKEREISASTIKKKPERIMIIRLVIFYVLICIFLLFFLYTSEKGFLIICVLMMICFNGLLINRLITLENGRTLRWAL